MKRFFLIIYFLIIVIFNILYADDFTLQQINVPYKSDLYIELERGEECIWSLGPRAVRALTINNEERLQLIDELPLYGELNGLEINGNYAYTHVGPPFTETILYRIYLNDDNLVLADSLHFPPPAHYIQFYKSFNRIFAQVSYSSYTILYIFDNDTFELLHQYNLDDEFPDVYSFAPINDTYVYGRDRNNTNIRHIYNITNVDSIHQVALIDITDLNVETEYEESLNDSIFVFLGFHTATFINISDITDWHVDSQIKFDQSNYGCNDIAILENNRIILPRQSTFDLYDMSDCSNPRLITSCYNDFSCSPCPIVGYDTYFCTANFYLGIDELRTEGDLIKYGGRWPKFASTRDVIKHNDNLIIKTFEEYNLHFFDISNLYDPQYICTPLENYYLYGIDFFGNKMAVSKKSRDDPNNKSIDVYDITDVENLQLLNSIENSSGPIVLFANDNILFTIEYYSGAYHFNKYDISEIGTPDRLFEFTLPGYLWGFDIYGNYAYVANDDNLYIIGNILSSDTPEIINIIGLNEYVTLRIEGEVLLLFNYGSSSTWVELYDLTNPEELVCEHVVFLEFSEGISLHNDLLFVGYNNVDVYDLKNCSFFIDDPISTFYTTFGLQWMEFFEKNDQNFFYYVGQAGVALYEYNYTVGVDEEPEQNISLLTSYPNPFSTSTTISLSLTTDLHELSQINIYNIKGQLVRNLPFAPSPLHSIEVTWDGKDENRNEVGTGVYFYKLNGSDEHIGKVVKLR